MALKNEADDVPIAEDHQLSPIVNDENSPQNPAPSNQEGVPQLPVPFFADPFQYIRNFQYIRFIQFMAAMNAFTPLPPAAVSSTAPPAVTAARRRIGPPRPVEAAAGIHSRRRRKDSKIFLWQFLLDILGNARHTHIIQWTKEMEFKLIDPEAVARLWGELNGNPTMNYDKMSRAIRDYYGKNIMQKVSGEKHGYRFVNIPGNSEDSSSRSQESASVSSASVENST